MTKLHDMVKTMDPTEALATLSAEIKGLITHIDEDARVRFITELIGGRGEDKISSMVHL